MKQRKKLCYRNEKGDQGAVCTSVCFTGYKTLVWTFFQVGYLFFASLIAKEFSRISQNIVF